MFSENVSDPDAWLKMPVPLVMFPVNDVLGELGELVPWNVPPKELPFGIEKEAVRVTPPEPTTICENATMPVPKGVICPDAPPGAKLVPTGGLGAEPVKLSVTGVLVAKARRASRAAQASKRGVRIMLAMVNEWSASEQ